MHQRCLWSALFSSLEKEMGKEVGLQHLSVTEESNHAALSALWVHDRQPTAAQSAVCLRTLSDF